VSRVQAVRAPDVGPGCGRGGSCHAMGSETRRRVQAGMGRSIPATLPPRPGQINQRWARQARPDAVSSPTVSGVGRWPADSDHRKMQTTGNWKMQTTGNCPRSALTAREGRAYIASIDADADACRRQTLPLKCRAALPDLGRERRSVALVGGVALCQVHVDIGRRPTIVGRC
jgi:hypothetical protein